MQANPQIPTTPPLSGADAISKINDALKTLGTDFSGDIDPAAYAWPYSTWADTANGVKKRRNAAGSDWIVEGQLFAKPQQQYDQGSEPTTDIGDIWINGIGPCRWDATDSKYYRIGFLNSTRFTSNGTFVADKYTKHARLSGVAGGAGGGGGSGKINTTGSICGGGGGAGESVIDLVVTITPNTSIPVTIGAGGAAGVGHASNVAGDAGGNGGNTVFGSYLTLHAGSGGGGGNDTDKSGIGGNGYPSGSWGSYMSDQPSATLYVISGAGASSPFGGGGGGVPIRGYNQNGNNGSGYGSGGSGGGGSNNASYWGGNGGSGASGLLIVEY